MVKDPEQLLYPFLGLGFYMERVFKIQMPGPHPAFLLVGLEEPQLPRAENYMLRTTTKLFLRLELHC